MALSGASRRNQILSSQKQIPSSPVIEGKDLIYSYKLIEGVMPKTGGTTALFIDSIGVGGGIGPGFHGVGAGGRGVGVRRYSITGCSTLKSAGRLGRIYCAGTAEDYAAVHALQDQFSVVPLSAFGKPYTPPPGGVGASLDMKIGVRDQVDGMESEAYFDYLAQRLKANPPKPPDMPMVERMARIGLVPGQQYVLRFEKGQMPPVEAFWSLTMYDKELFFVVNPISSQHPSTERPPWDWRILINGKGDEMLYERGMIKTDELPFAELKKRAHINPAAEAANNDPDFSKRIRKDHTGM